MPKYFFPSPFKINDKININDITLTSDIINRNLFDSGKSALRIALRRLNLPLNAKVGIPAFCCNAVEDAVRKENLIPFFFDLIDINTYWARYSPDIILKENIQAIIITHLYGFKHPDTADILNFCAKNKVRVIHDLAQSFGIDVSDFEKDIIIYSFGAGKSTTAALGGEIVNPDDTQAGALLQRVPKASLKQKFDSFLFYYSRLYGYKLKILITLLNFIYRIILRTGFIKTSDVIRRMSNFQIKKASEAKCLTLSKSDERKARYDYLSNSLYHNDKIRLTYDDSHGLYFKLVLYIPDNVNRLVSYLTNHKVPFYRLGPDMNLKYRIKEILPNFYKSYNNFVEISTERSIDMYEIKRVEKILKAYK